MTMAVGRGSGPWNDRNKFRAGKTHGRGLRFPPLIEPRTGFSRE